MRSKIMILLLSLSSLSMPITINDFAPMKIGNTWDYSYSNLSWDGFYRWWDLDSINIHLALTQIIPAGNDTLVIFNCSKKGFHKSQTVYPPGPVDSIAISSDSIDTAIISGASIRCFDVRDGASVYPFWKAHSINSDSLHLGFYNNDSAYYLFTPYSNSVLPGSSIYLQNVGLYEYHDSLVSTRGSWHETIRLLHFNGISSTLPIRNIVRQNLNKDNNIKPKKVLCLNHGKNSTDKGLVTLLNGRRVIPRATRLPAIVTIQQKNRQ
jgi:hypothetical protein